jgi:hypothetical protein
MTEQIKLGYEQTSLSRKVHANVIPNSKDAATNKRGIPYAPFVERVEDYVTTRADVEKTLQSFSEMIS